MDQSTILDKNKHKTNESRINNNAKNKMNKSINLWMHMQNLCYNHFKTERKQELLKSYIAIYQIYLKINRKQSYITIYLIYPDIKQMNSKYDVGYNKL